MISPSHSLIFKTLWFIKKKEKIVNELLGFQKLNSSVGSVGLHEVNLVFDLIMKFLAQMVVVVFVLYVQSTWGFTPDPTLGEAKGP